MIAHAKGTTVEVYRDQLQATRRLASGVATELDTCLAALVFKP